MTEQLKELKLTSNLERSPDSTPIKVRQGESLGIDVKATYNNKPLQIPVGATCVLRVWTAGTTGTLYVNKTGTVVSATKGKIRIELLPEETNFTAGEYKGEIRIVHSESGSDSNIATAWYGDFVVEEANTTGLGGVGTFAGLEMADIDDFSDSGKMDQYVVTYNQSTDSYILAAVSGSGTVTSVAVSGSDGIEVDSGSPITGAGTIAIGVDASAMKAHLDLEIGTDVQAYNAKLDSIAGLTPGDEGKMIGSDGLGGYQIQTASETRAYLNVEDGATADQSDAEIETAYNNQVDVVGQAEAEAGISTTVRRWTAERVAQAIAALGGGGGTGGWFATMNATNLVGIMSASPIGYAVAELDTANEDAYGVGLQTADSTQQSDTIGLELPIPDFVTEYDDGEAIRIRFFGDSTSSTQCKMDVEVIGVNDGGANTSLHTESGVTVSTVDTVEELLIDSTDLGATIYDALLVRITFYTKDSDAIYITSISARGA